MPFMRRAARITFRLLSAASFVATCTLLLARWYHVPVAQCWTLVPYFGMTAYFLFILDPMEIGRALVRGAKTPRYGRRSGSKP